MPVAPTAPAAAPAIACLRVSFMSLGRGLDADERPQLALQVGDDLPVRERRREVLRQRVQRPTVPPREQDVPLVGVLVDGVHRRGNPVRAHGPARVTETWDRLLVLAAAGAARDRRASGIATEVDVQLAPRGAAAGLLPHEADEVAPV